MKSKNLLYLACIVGYLFLLIPVLTAEDDADSQIVKAVKTDSMLVLKAAPSGPAQILAYSNESKELSVYEVDELALKYKTKVLLGAYPHQAVRLNDGNILIALGYGRGALSDPVRLIRLDKNFKNEQELFKVESPRSQITYLKEIGDKVWISYFDSKYFTVRGYFNSQGKTPWKLQEEVRERLATSLAIMPPFQAIGRPYGDKIGADGDARVEIGKEVFNLPTLRGVSSIALLPPGGRKYPKVLAGDGWHQNYGKIAKARLTMFSFDASKKSYTSEVLDTDPEQFQINKIIPLLHDRKLLLLAGGNKALNLYDSTNKWKRQRLFTSENENVVFDFALLSKDSESILVALYDGQVTVKKVAL